MKILKKYIGNISLALLFLILAISVNCQQNLTLLQGAYLGQKRPGNESVVFAKNIISTELYEHSAPAFSADGKTVLWTVVEMNKLSRLLEMTMKEKTWSAPHRPSFADKLHDDFYPFFSYDGKKLFFCSRRLLPGGSPVKDIALWVVERKGGVWGSPVPVDSSVSKGFEYAHSVSKFGNLIFSAREVVNSKATWKFYASKSINGNTQTFKCSMQILTTAAMWMGPTLPRTKAF